MTTLPRKNGCVALIAATAIAAILMAILPAIPLVLPTASAALTNTYVNGSQGLEVPYQSGADTNWRDMYVQHDFWGLHVDNSAVFALQNNHYVTPTAIGSGTLWPQAYVIVKG